MKDHPLPWVAKFPIVGEGANVYDANDVPIFAERLDLDLAVKIAAAMNSAYTRSGLVDGADALGDDRKGDVNG